MKEIYAMKSDGTIYPVTNESLIQTKQQVVLELERAQKEFDEKTLEFQTHINTLKNQIAEINSILEIKGFE
jgi:hypothetical protein